MTFKVGTGRKTARNLNSHQFSTHHVLWSWTSYTVLWIKCRIGKLEKIRLNPSVIFRQGFPTHARRLGQVESTHNENPWTCHDKGIHNTIMHRLVRAGRISEFYRLVIDWTSRSQNTNIEHTLYTVQMTGVTLKMATEKLEWTWLSNQEQMTSFANFARTSPFPCMYCYAWLDRLKLDTISLVAGLSSITNPY